METVLAAALEQAQTPLQIGRLFWRELRDWPGAIRRAHRYERSRIPMNTPEPMTPWKWFLALALFILPVLSLVSNHLLASIGLLLLPIFWGTLVAVVVVSVGKGFPRWSVPYLGVLVFGVTLLGLFVPIWERVYPFTKNILGPEPWNLPQRVIYQALQSGSAWLLSLAIAGLLVFLLRFRSRSRSLSEAVMRDWTVLSFMLYGGTVISIVLAFEEYRYDDAWKIAAWACLGLGAWRYLKSETTRKRISALIVGVTAAYWIVAVGKLILVPLQTWGAFHGYQYETYRWFAFWQTLAEWVWVLIVLLIPAIFYRGQRREDSNTISKDKFIPA
jgi:hypothetical protein